ncbi:type II/IV secretion system protein [Victivallaceae bacterium BBE-744-WT-12]|jgi:type II secretion system protein E|uniref:Type II/IV secretion system protein n=2 Tax=Victivallis lenta TaxID=2606640 RepID=A0A844G4B1_9BACT|nr:GspE/PulE family protein [Victivallis lenta]AVM45543.1 pilus assembly protein PilB [Victivallales bacterium CCUG 44730]MBS1455041.1 type II/IV secretion system protein [Lentisphaeria bacterium]MBS5532820.1 type II/IV secretion system protein [bacterium]MST98587.1 type II/IV secretion system protein [Victivallis lenta]HBP07941.1 type II/IV secretion system protein [Lentisphaeria bacterium]
MLDIENSALIDLLKTDYAPGNPGLREQLDEVAEEVERSGKPVMEIIENYGLFSRADLLQVIANSLGSYVWDPRSADVKKEVIASIDTNTARSYGVIPVALEDDTLHLAMRNPLDYQTVESLRFILGKNILPVAVDPDMFDSELERYYPEEVDSVADIIAELGPSQLLEDSTKSDEERANDAPIVKFVDVVMQQAIKDKASDIHFEPFEKEFRIRYRVDGALYEMPPPPKSLAIPVISRVKIISGLNISERRRPQDGRIQLKFQGRPVDLRVSCLPTSYGESVVLRVLDRTVVNLQLDSLGIGQDVLDKLREMIHLPNGILLVTGPTGSGKTTTLYSALGEVNTVEDKLLTAEDPVEYDIEGIVQVPINDAVGMTFQRALRAFLRQDPDRILVGEIRDFETAQIAIEASLTGHFVFSTLHTNDSASTVTRLVDMGVEPFLICSSLAGILAQRLVRRVCKNCKTYYVPSDSDLERLGIDRSVVGDHKFCYGRGCPNCNHTGYKGRKALTELLVVNNEIREMIANEAPANHLREKARELGMRTLREDGLAAVMNGETTVDEVVRYT